MHYSVTWVDKSYAGLRVREHPLLADPWRDGVNGARLPSELAKVCERLAYRVGKRLDTRHPWRLVVKERPLLNIGHNVSRHSAKSLSHVVDCLDEESHSDTIVAYLERDSDGDWWWHRAKAGGGYHRTRVKRAPLYGYSAKA